MIVNFQDSNSFLEKRSNGLGSFDEVIVHYRARSDDGKSFFQFLRFEENKILCLNFFRTIDQIKILSYFSRENVYLLKKYNSKNQIAQLLFFVAFLLTLVKMNY